MGLESTMRQWLLEPMVGRLVAAAFGPNLVMVLRHFVQRMVTRRIEDRDAFVSGEVLKASP